MRQQTAIKLLAQAAKSQTCSLRVHGQCMQPMLKDGDQIWFSAPFNSYQRGDIVLAQTEAGELVCHRIIQAEPDGFWLCGDASYTAQLHQPKSILALVNTVERKDRRLHLGSKPGREVDSLLAYLHSLSLAQHKPWLRRLINIVRRVGLHLRRLAWRTGDFTVDRGNEASFDSNLPERTL